MRASVECGCHRRSPVRDQDLHFAALFLPMPPLSPPPIPRAVAPTTVRLDISTVCQLRCPVCPTAKGTIARELGGGFLRRETFARFLRDNPAVRALELSNWGEIFLNPDLVDLMEIAAHEGVALHADNGVNLNHASAEALESLVRLGFRSLTCSIDGASPATYTLYRVRGDFSRVIDHIRIINAHKARLGTAFPKLRWQFVIFGHNEHEIPLARALAAELGMELKFKLSWAGSGEGAYSPIRDPAWVRAQTGLTHLGRREHRVARRLLYDPERICSQLWEKPQINWDGRVLGCCVNHWGDFGHAFNDGLSAVMQGGPMRYARRMLVGEAPPRADIPCTRCHRYHEMRATGIWLDPVTHDATRPESPALALQRALAAPGRTWQLATRPREALKKVMRWVGETRARAKVEAGPVI